MPGLNRQQLTAAGAYRAQLRARRGGPAQTAGTVLAQARALDGWQEARDRQLEEARAAAFEERAAIIAEGAHVDRATAERWAAECIRRVPGAV